MLTVTRFDLNYFFFLIFREKHPAFCRLTDANATPLLWEPRISLVWTAIIKKVNLGTLLLNAGVRCPVPRQLTLPLSPCRMDVNLFALPMGLQHPPWPSTWPVSYSLPGSGAWVLLSEKFGHGGFV